MAKFNNPRKGFHFTIDFPFYPIEPIAFQKVTLPDHEIEQVEHSEGVYDIKTGGRIKLSNLMVEKLASTNASDLFFRNWANLVADALTNGGVLPIAYKRTCLVKEIAENGIIVLDVHEFIGCWPTKINGKDLDRTSSDNTILSVELSVDIYDQGNA